MQAMNDKVAHFLNNTQQFTIPIFQRKYSWTKDQCKQLLEDIIRVGINDEDNHFIGSIVYLGMNDDIIPTYRVIDGQQRITTISLLIAALAKYLYENPEVKLEHDMNTKKLIKYYLINSDEEGELRYKLKLTHEDKKTYEKIISHLCSDEEVEFTKKDSKNIINNFKYFKREINEDNAQDIFNGFKKLLIIIISLKESIDNPQLIFESLNSTGLPLTKADLIRNYVLMGLSPVEQDNIYNSYWHDMELLFEENKSSFDEFIKHYITIKNNKVPVYREIYIQFKKYAQKFINNYEAADKFEKIKALVKDINKYVKYYSKITMGLEEDNDIKYALNSLHEINYNVCYPFILKVYEDYDNNIITKSECIEIINLTESYLLRRYICDIPSNSMQKTFSELYNELDKNNYLESFKAVMILKDTYKRIPTNKEFAKRFREKDLYHGKNTQYIFRKLENWGFEKEPTRIEAYTIEHIMPQNPNLSQEWIDDLGPNYEQIQEKYLHTIGNLTLTGYNPNLSDRPFKDKRDIEKGFKNSSIRLNVFLQDLDTWNEKEIKARAQRLSDNALKIWPYPELDKETLNKYKPKIESDSNMSETDKLKLNYWINFDNILVNEYPNFKSSAPKPRNYYDIHIGTKHSHLALTINTQSKIIRSMVYMYGNNNLFEYLYSFKDEIETEIGFELDWRKLKNDAQIGINKSVDIKDETKWKENARWQLDMAKKLHTVFYNRINEFNPL